jgi:hypothetical protein
MVQDLLETIRSKGFDPSEFGLTEEVVRLRLVMSAQAEREVTAFSPPIQPQRKKEAVLKRLYQEARSIADTVVNRLELKHSGRDLLRFFPGRGDTNIAILIALALGQQNKAMGVPSGQRNDASVEQLETALAAAGHCRYADRHHPIEAKSLAMKRTKSLLKRVVLRSQSGSERAVTPVSTFQRSVCLVVFDSPRQRFCYSRDSRCECSTGSVASY